mmetsp:Transcript_41937/g.112329  ORF Transcript_41937/g.112329 Transcript_41937/m.112329 type:complete len:243 (-) Transcript_41937:1922-2650(-)
MRRHGRRFPRREDPCPPSRRQDRHHRPHRPKRPRPQARDPERARLPRSGRRPSPPPHQGPRPRRRPSGPKVRPTPQPRRAAVRQSPRLPWRSLGELYPRFSLEDPVVWPRLRRLLLENPIFPTEGPRCSARSRPRRPKRPPPARSPAPAPGCRGPEEASNRASSPPSPPPPGDQSPASPPPVLGHRRPHSEPRPCHLSALSPTPRTPSASRHWGTTFWHPPSSSKWQELMTLAFRCPSEAHA